MGSSRAGPRRLNSKACRAGLVSTWSRAAALGGQAASPGDQQNTHAHTQGSLHAREQPQAGSRLGDVSFSAMQRIWGKHGVQPHRLECHLISNDPDVDLKAADVIGLYLSPPAHAAVFSVDEKTTIQALDRKDRMLPLAPGGAQSHSFKYWRNGTLSLFAPLNTATGEVLDMPAARHTSEQFVSLLGDVVARQPLGRCIYAICDNVSGHTTALVQGLLAEQPNVRSNNPHLFIMAQPSRELVCAHPARRYQQGRLHIDFKLRQEAHTSHPPIQQILQAHQVDVRRSAASIPPISKTHWTRHYERTLALRALDRRLCSQR